MDTLPVSFLDVDQLLDASEPRARFRWGQLAAVFGLVALLGMFSSRGSSAQGAISILVMVGLMGMVAILFSTVYFASRAQRDEMGRLNAIEELVQLRRWQEAAMLVQATLMRPARSMAARVQALVYFSMVLGRFHRFDDAVKIYDYLLAEIPLDDLGIQTVQLGRAVAMLREDHLFDADRAIAELRRGDRGGESPGLALLEIYRDVKTGHPTEAIETFEKRLDQMRKHLGHRVADAWALAARAYDLLGDAGKSKAAYENATLLMPLSELQRRYPEILPLAEKYSPAAAPAEVA